MVDLLWIIPVGIFGALCFGVGYLLGVILGEIRATKIFHGHFMQKEPKP